MGCKVGLVGCLLPPFGSQKVSCKGEDHLKGICIYVNGRVKNKISDLQHIMTYKAIMKRHPETAGGTIHPRYHGFSRIFLL